MSKYSKNTKKNNGNNKNAKNTKNSNANKAAYAIAHRIARWMGRGDGYAVNYSGNRGFYPTIIGRKDLYTKSSMDLGEDPDLVIFISHDGEIVRRNQAAVPDVEQLVVSFEKQTSHEPEAVRRTIRLVEKAADMLKAKYPREPIKDKPKVLIFSDFPLLTAQVLVESCPHLDCYYADNTFYVKGKRGIKMALAAYQASQLLSSSYTGGWSRLGEKIVTKPVVPTWLKDYLKK
ncbi:MAG: hypothetical protein IKK52_01975 [Alphaproteobacteria bacterium]|nr:hypothetical protein [Alphaproteobacteria bacterium]